MIFGMNPSANLKMKIIQKIFKNLLTTIKKSAIIKTMKTKRGNKNDNGKLRNEKTADPAKF